jgi:hypothetical protein
MKIASLILTAGTAAFLTFSGVDAQAQGRQRGGPEGQGRGDFDPTQMRQRMFEGVREQLEVKDDAEWKVIEERVAKVWDARRDVGVAGAGGMRMMARRNPGDDNASGDQPNRRRFGPEPSPEQEALQKAIDSNAPTADLKAAIAKYRESREQKQAAFKKAQQDLKAVLNVKQEAVALSMGLID